MEFVLKRSSGTPRDFSNIEDLKNFMFGLTFNSKNFCIYIYDETLKYHYIKVTGKYREYTVAHRVRSTKMYYRRINTIYKIRAVDKAMWIPKFIELIEEIISSNP